MRSQRTPESDGALLVNLDLGTKRIGADRTDTSRQPSPHIGRGATKGHKFFKERGGQQ